MRDRVSSQVTMLIRLYKPYGVLCQFRDPERPTLADLLPVPGVYPAGRLDMDSEGLLLLTDDGTLQARIAEPRHKLAKTYQVQVEGQPDAAAFAPLAERLCGGVALGDGPAKALAVRQIPPPDVPERTPPVTPHRAARSSWVEIVLSEGRNRQVRRMLAAVGLPVLRLIRVRIGEITLTGLEPGAWEQIPVPGELDTAPVRRSRPRRPGTPPARPRRARDRQR
ncbi:MAG: pseudouridine synthase [Pseudomonadales bacterium]